MVFIALLLVVIVFFKSILPVKEGMTGPKEYSFKENNDVYDEFYANIYDHLVFSGVKNEYEVGNIIKNDDR